MTFTLYQRKTRPAIEKCIDLPLIVKTVGHYIVPENGHDTGTIDDTLRIFWFVKGEGIIRCGKRSIKVSAGQVAVYQPFAEFYVQAHGAALEYFWTSLLGKLITPIAQSFGFDSSGRYEATEIPSALIDTIHAQLDDTSPASLRQSSSYSYDLLSRIKQTAEKDTNHDLCNRALKLIKTQWQDCNFSINSCAQQLRIHRSSLNRHFQDHVGCSPGQYLIRFRLQEAVQRLKESNIPVASIANTVGYADPHYFSRHFKHEIGCTPSEFRQHNVSVPWE